MKMWTIKAVVVTGCLQLALATGFSQAFARDAEGPNVGGGGNKKGSELLDIYLDKNKISRESILESLEPILSEVRERLPGLANKIEHNWENRNYYFVDDKFEFGRYGDRETGVVYKSEQVAVQNDRNVFIRKSLFDGMKKSSQDALFVHEALMTDYVESELIKSGKRKVGDSEGLATKFVERMRGFKIAPNENIEPRDVLEMTAKIINVKTLSANELKNAAKKFNFGSYKFKEELVQEQNVSSEAFKKDQVERQKRDAMFAEEEARLRPMMMHGNKALTELVHEHVRLCKKVGYSKEKKWDPKLPLNEYLSLQEKVQKITDKIAHDAGFDTSIYQKLTIDGVQKTLRYKVNKVSTEHLAALLTGVLLRARYQINDSVGFQIASLGRESPYVNFTYDEMKQRLKNAYPIKSASFEGSIDATKKKIDELGEDERVSIGCSYVVGDTPTRETRVTVFNESWRSHEEKYGNIHSLVNEIGEFKEWNASEKTAFLNSLYVGWRIAELMILNKKVEKDIGAESSDEEKDVQSTNAQ